MMHVIRSGYGPGWDYRQNIYIDGTGVIRRVQSYRRTRDGEMAYGQLARSRFSVGCAGPHRSFMIWKAKRWQSTRSSEGSVPL